MKKHVILILILILASVSMIFYANKRYEFFEDEVTSYGVANNGQYRVFIFGYDLEQEVSDLLNEYAFGNNLRETFEKTKILITDIQTNGIKQSNIYHAAINYKNQKQTLVWRNASYFRDYLTIQKDERFAVWKTYIAAIRDVHPPLYFIMLNMICSFIPNVFSCWPAFAINWFSMIGIGLLLYYIAKEYYVSERCALLVVLYYVLSRGGISTAYLFRPYALLTFFTVAFVLIHLQLQKNDWEATGRMRWLLGVVTVLGYLTQYYFLFVAVTVFVVSLIDIIRCGSMSRLKKYIRTFIWSALTGILLWPFSIKHIFMSSRGTEALGAVTDTSKTKQFAEFCKIILKDVFVGHEILLFLLIIICGIIFLKYKNKWFDRIHYNLFLCWSIILVYLLIAGTISPYATSRYMMCIYPLISLMIIYILSKGLPLIPWIKLQQVLPIFAITVIMVWGVFQQPDDYYKLDSEQKSKLVQLYDSSLDCIYVYKNWNEYVSSIPDFMNYNCTLLLSDAQLGALSEDVVISENKEMILYLSKFSNFTADEILEIMGYNTYEEVADKSWATVYSIQR